MRQRGWHLICVYIALEACLNVSARSFQLFNAWYFLRVHSDPGHLALILTVLQVIASCVGLALALHFARHLRASAQPPRSVPTPSVLKDIRACHGCRHSAWGIPRLAKVVSQHTLASLGLASLGSGMICFSLVSRVELLCALALLMGVGISTFNVTVNARRALSIPDGFRSAMESSLLFVCTLAVPFGLALSQQALLRTTPDGVIAAGGTVFCAAVLFIICSPSLRRMLNATGPGPYYQRLYSDLFVR